MTAAAMSPLPAIEARFLGDLMPQLVALRHAIHRRPDLSGHEAPTARRLLDFLMPFQPEGIIEKLGGHGLAVVFSASQPGPTTIFTSELDALPITDQGQVSHRSRVPGVGHLCGHDGHMVAAAGLGPLLARRRPRKGQVMLLFRPQEETGRGAPAVAADPRLVEMAPNYIFGFHTIPGYPLGAVLYRHGLFAWAATDYVVELVGKSAHGGQPGAGRSPAMALAKIIERFDNLSSWSDLDPQAYASQAAYARLGESDHGTTPGIARMRATLRSHSDEGLQRLCDHTA
jgi:amidohydrolase